VRRGVVVAAAAVLAATAIGVAPGAAATQSQKASGSTITIGQLAAITGAAGASGKVTMGPDIMNAWVKWTNAHGGVAGHPVKVVTLDTRSDPAQANADLKQLVEQDNVVAIVGQSDSSTEPTWKAYVDAHPVPIIGGPAYSANWFTDQNFYPAGGTVVSVVWGETFAAKHAGVKKLASLLCSNATVCQGARPLVLAGAKDNGIDVVYDQVADQAATSYTPQCLAMKNAGADAVLPFVNNAVLARDCFRQNYRPTWVGSENSIPPQQLKQVPQFNGLVGPQSSFPYYFQFPQTKPYFQAVAKYAPQFAKGGSKYGTITVGAPLVWTAGEAFKKAVENSGVSASDTVTRADVVKGLAQFQNETLGGITVPLTYNDGSKPNPQQKCFFLYKVQKSQYVPTPSNKLTPFCQP
jgi:branched-chain amino acid transport system substrate-binding protein